MAQSGRNAELAAGAGITFQNSSAYKSSFTDSSFSAPTQSMDSGGGAKSTGATTMPGASQGKIGVGNADRGGMPNMMSNYRPPTAGSMPARGGGGGLRGGFSFGGGGGMFGRVR
jgi:hypothetical protein